MLNTPSDFFNWLTIGGVDLVKGVVTPEEQFSKEHLLASFGLATVFIGGVRIPNGTAGTVSTVSKATPTKVKNTVPSSHVKSSQKLGTLTNIYEWYRVNVPEIGLVYDSIGGYHLIVKKAEGGSGGGSRGSGKGSGSGKDIQIPSVRNNEFNKWFDNLSVDKFEEMWSVPHLRSKIEDRIRRPGGYHEWHLVARTPKFKQWGVSMDDIKDMRTLTKDVEFVNPPGRHGRRGSTKAHNEILKIIDSAPNYESFVRELNEWVSKRMKNGVLDLPEGLRR
ncbi:hypothetical protein [Oceanobacillus sp. FSL H7-0719]|uniref:hypothetical protein n=1 Tax=Oceanobacillus sp. FSL H7-0719 TaxID=2954507 RepID=UPI003251BACE